MSVKLKYDISLLQPSVYLILFSLCKIIYLIIFLSLFNLLILFVVVTLLYTQGRCIAWNVLQECRCAGITVLWPTQCMCRGPSGRRHRRLNCLWRKLGPKAVHSVYFQNSWRESERWNAQLLLAGHRGTTHAQILIHVFSLISSSCC